MIVLKPFFPGIEYPLTHPRIGWRKALGAVVGSTSAAGFAAINASTDRTDTFWRPTALPATWTVTLDPAQVLSYAGIAAHDLGSKGATVFFETWDGTDWVVQGSVAPANDEPIFFLFPEVTTAQYRARVTGSTMPTIAVIRAGRVMEWQRMATYAPSVSLERAVRTAYSVNMTDGGQWAGRSITRRGTTPQMAVQHLSEDWVTAEFVPFSAAARSVPFFIADKPSQYPSSVAYAFAQGDLIPQRGMPNRNVANEVTLDLMGYQSRV